MIEFKNVEMFEPEHRRWRILYILRTQWMWKDNLLKGAGGISDAHQRGDYGGRQKCGSHGCGAEGDRDGVPELCLVPHHDCV